jgi:hypothetical protein
MILCFKVRKRKHADISNIKDKDGEETIITENECWKGLKRSLGSTPNFTVETVKPREK